MHCPKCGLDLPSTALDCTRCGIVFAKYRPEVRDDASYAAFRTATAPNEDGDLRNGRIGRAEITVLGTGLIAASVVYAIPFTRIVFSLIVTLFHEFGHAVVGWLFGIPSLPAFDFVYGGGWTHYGNFHPSIALAIAGVFGYGMWLFRANRKSMILIGVLLLLWLLIVSAEWRRELVIASAGHAAEFVLAGIFFYKALAGVGWRIPEVERPLGAFVAFFVQIHSMAFARRLMHDADFLAWYREGKGGAAMNDLEIVSLDLNIYARMHTTIQSVAALLLVFSFVPIAIALLWYFQRSRWHRALRMLRTADA